MKIHYIIYRSKTTGREYTVYTRDIDFLIENLELIRDSNQMELVRLTTRDLNTEA